MPTPMTIEMEEETRQAAFDALCILGDHCVLDDTFRNELESEVRTAISLPRVSVIDAQRQAALDALKNFMNCSWSFYRDESQDGITKVPRDVVFCAAELKKHGDILLSALQSSTGE